MGEHRPTPRMLAGRTDPARTVRPVDFTANGAAPRPAGSTASSTAGSTTPEHGTRGRSTASDTLPARPRRARTVELPRQAPAPPSGAVHSLRPEDPRPAPRPLRIDEGEIRTVGIGVLERERIVHAVADPQEAWTADAGVSDHFLRGGIVAQVRRADNAVIGVFSRGYALSVRPADYEPAAGTAPESSGRAVRGGRGTRHPTTRRELIERMREAGFEIAAGSSHGRVTHPDHPGLFVPLASTPSDVRYTRHAVTQIRRVFGIDLRR